MSIITRLHELKRTSFNVAYTAIDTVLFDLTSDTYPGKYKENKVIKMNEPDLFHELDLKVREIWDTDLWLPVYNGRISDSICADFLCPEGYVFGNEIYMTLKKTILEHGGNFREGISQDDPGLSGNLDVKALKSFLESEKKKVAFMAVTAPTLNGGAVSFDNIISVRKLLSDYKIACPIIWDGARFSENAFLLKNNGMYSHSKSIKEINQEFSKNFDLIVISGKKVLASPMGGLVIFYNRKLYDESLKIHYLLIGSRNKGGIPYNYLRFLWSDLDKSIDESTLARRFHTINLFVKRLLSRHVPVSSYSMSRVTIDAVEFLKASHHCRFPAQTLLCLLYLLSGLKAIGTFNAFSGDNDQNVKDEIYLSFNREEYSSDYFESLADIIGDMYDFINEIPLRGLEESIVPSQKLPFYKNFRPKDEAFWDKISSPLFLDRKIRSITGNGRYINNNATFGNSSFSRFKEFITSALNLPEHYDIVPAAWERGPLYVLLRAFLSLDPALEIRISKKVKERELISSLFNYLKLKALRKEKNKNLRKISLDIQSPEDDTESESCLVSLDDKNIKRLLYGECTLRAKVDYVFYYCGGITERDLLPVGFIIIHTMNVIYEKLIHDMIYFIGSHEEGGLASGLFDIAVQILKNEKTGCIH